MHGRKRRQTSTLNLPLVHCTSFGEIVGLRCTLCCVPWRNAYNFFDQTLPFISLFFLCGYYSRAAFISLGKPVMVKMDKIDSPGPIKKMTPELILLQNMDTLWKIWTTCHRWKNVDPQHISLAKFGPVAYLAGFRGFWKLLWPVSSAELTGQRQQYIGNVLLSLARQFSRTQHSASAYIVLSLRRTQVSNAVWRRWGILMKSSHLYETVNSTNVFSSHWFSFVWLAYRIRSVVAGIGDPPF